MRGRPSRVNQPVLVLLPARARLAGLPGGPGRRCGLRVRGGLKAAGEISTVYLDRRDDSQHRDGEYVDPRNAGTLVKTYAARWEKVQVGRDSTLSVIDNAVRLHINPAPFLAMSSYQAAEGRQGRGRAVDVG